MPVSLVDLAAGREVDTLFFSDRGNYVAACDDGQSVLVRMTAMQTGNTSVRRLTVAEPSRLTDTGEILGPLSYTTDGLYNKVFAVPGSKVGVALGYLGAPGITTFRIPGLQVLDSSPHSSTRSHRRP